MCVAEHVYYTAHTCKFLVKSWCFYVLAVLESEPEKKDFHEKFRENDFTKIWQWNFTTLILYPFDTYSSLCDFFFKTESKQKKKCLLDEKRSKEIGYFPFFEIHMLRPYILQ